MVCLNILNKETFSEEITRSEMLSKSDGFVVDAKDFGIYWVSRQAYMTYQGNAELTKKEKCLCLQETVKLNRQGLVFIQNLAMKWLLKIKWSDFKLALSILSGAIA